jgi:DNA polymerase-1
MRPLAVVDFETNKIENRPDYPPRPVGVSIRKRGRAKYFAWGHPCENNCTKADARKALLEVYENYNVAFHNAAFDIDVGETHLGLPFPDEFEDTLFLGYLRDPRQESLGLKPMADQWLEMPPDEQDALRDWILENVPEAKRAPTKWGAYIALAPGKLVGKYANGDTIRTEKLYRLFMPYIKDNNMLAAYQLEKDVLKVKLAMERHGIQTAKARIKKDLAKFHDAQEAARRSLYGKLKITKAYEANCPKGFFNINSAEQLADALENAGMVDEWILTEKGNRSTSLENLTEVVADKHFLKMYSIYATLEKSITGFLTPWYETGQKDGLGRLYPTFNQVRSYNKYQNVGFGTKTGRPSVSNPNFNNIPANVDEAKNAAVLREVQKYVKKFGVNFIGLRDYITPTPGNWLITRDYQQQELRVLAHYEDGALMDLFNENPDIDIHADIAAELSQRTGRVLPRKASKTIAFGILYGFGTDTLAEALDTTYNDAMYLRETFLKMLGGVDKLRRRLMRCEHVEEPIRTLGGRLYYCEDPKFLKGRLQTFGYKMLNLLIQGTSADITKRAMVDAHNALKGQIVIQLYDEILVDTPDYKHDMQILRDAMESAFSEKLDVALPTDGEWSKVSWGRMKPYRGAMRGRAWS